MSLYSLNGRNRLLGAGIAALLFLTSLPLFSQTSGGKDCLPEWQPGMLDLHFISTGCGNCSFCILPDGTTFLVDAGELARPDIRAGAPKPDETKSTGEWIADYIQQFSPAGKDTKLDFVLLTHFHGDHTGAIDKVRESVPFGTLIDRNTAQVGSSSQIHLLKDPASFPDFNIRILFASGKIAHKTKEKVAITRYKPDDKPSENCLSVGFRMDYGPFKFYSGGDIPGVAPNGETDPKSMEVLVAPLVGPVDVAVLNHHGTRDTQCTEFVATLAPRVWISESWCIRHPGEEVIRRITSKGIYPGKRDIYSTYMAPENKAFMAPYLSDYKATDGHIVVRVAPGGASYDVFVLDDTTADRKVLMTNHYETK